MSGFDIALRHTYSQEINETSIENLMLALSANPDRKWRELWYYYTVNHWDADPKALLEQYEQNQLKSEVFSMTTAEYLREQGREQGLRDVALNMLKNNQSLDTVARYVNLPKDKLDTLKASLMQEEA